MNEKIKAAFEEVKESEGFKNTDEGFAHFKLYIDIQTKLEYPEGDEENKTPLEILESHEPKDQDGDK